MTYFDKQWFKIFRILRVIAYLALFLTFMIIPVSTIINGKSICMIYNKFGLLCPSCGVTRAFSCLMHSHFTTAFNYNPVFTLAIFPICVILFLDDSINVIRQLITKNYKYSILESLFFGWMD